MTTLREVIEAVVSAYTDNPMASHEQSLDAAVAAFKDRCEPRPLKTVRTAWDTGEIVQSRTLRYTLTVEDR